MRFKIEIHSQLVLQMSHIMDPDPISLGYLPHTFDSSHKMFPDPSELNTIALQRKFEKGTQFRTSADMRCDILVNE